MVLRQGNRFYRFEVLNGTYSQRIFDTLEQACEYARECQRLSRDERWPLGAHFIVRHQGEVVFDATEDPAPTTEDMLLSLHPQRRPVRAALAPRLDRPINGQFFMLVLLRSALCAAGIGTALGMLIGWMLKPASTETGSR